MSHYTKRLLLEGVHKQRLMVEQRHDGGGLILFSTERVEHFFAGLKMFCSNKGTGKDDSIKKIATFSDLYCIGTVMAIQIDFGKILLQMEREKLLIYDPVNTPILFAKLEEKMPPMMREMIRLLDAMNVGDALPAMIRRILEKCDVSLPELDEAIQEAKEALERRQYVMQKTSLRLGQKLQSLL